MRIYVPDEGCGFCGDQPVCAHDASEKGDHDVIRKMEGYRSCIYLYCFRQRRIYYRGSAVSAASGNAIIIPPYMTHMIIPDGEEPFVQYIIHFDFMIRRSAGL